MYNDKNEQTNISMNKTNDNSNSWYQSGKKLLKRIAGPLMFSAAAGSFGAGVSGCGSAQYYINNNTPENRAVAQKCMEKDYEFSKKPLDEALYSSFLRNMRALPSSIQYAPQNLEALKSRFGDAVIAVDEQNKLLAELSDTRIARLISYQLGKNVNHDGLDDLVYNSSDVDSIKDKLNQLSGLMAKVPFEARERLERMAREERNSDLKSAYDALMNFNVEHVRRVYLWSTANADIASLEGLIDDVDSSNVLCNAIYRSFKGVDQFELGKNTLENKLFGLSISDFVSRKSMFAELYDEGHRGNKKVEAVYWDIMKQIKEEAEDWVDESRHEICNQHLAALLNLAFEAHGHNRIDDLEYQAVVKYITQQALGMTDKNPQRSNRFTFLSITPVFSFFYPLRFHAWRTAFSPDTYTPDAEDPAVAFGQALRDGNAIKNGIMNRDFFAGWTGNRQTELICSFVSDAFQVAAAIGIPYLLNKDGVKAVQSAIPNASGGETGGPGTTN